MVPSAREAHLAVLMIGYSDPLTRRLASLARPSAPDGWCAVGWRLQGTGKRWPRRSASKRGPLGRRFRKVFQHVAERANSVGRRADSIGLRNILSLRLHGGF